MCKIRSHRRHCCGGGRCRRHRHRHCVRRESCPDDQGACAAALLRLAPPVRGAQPSLRGCQTHTCVFLNASLPIVQSGCAWCTTWARHQGDTVASKLLTAAAPQLVACGARAAQHPRRCCCPLPSHRCLCCSGQYCPHRRCSWRCCRHPAAGVGGDAALRRHAGSAAPATLPAPPHSHQERPFRVACRLHAPYCRDTATYHAVVPDRTPVGSHRTPRTPPPCGWQLGTWRRGA